MTTIKEPKTFFEFLKARQFGFGGPSLAELDLLAARRNYRRQGILYSVCAGSYIFVFRGKRNLIKVAT